MTESFIHKDQLSKGGARGRLQRRAACRQNETWAKTAEVGLRDAPHLDKIRGHKTDSIRSAGAHTHASLRTFKSLDSACLLRLGKTHGFSLVQREDRDCGVTVSKRLREFTLNIGTCEVPTTVQKHTPLHIDTHAILLALPPWAER